MKLLIAFLLITGSALANAASVTINPGDSITVRQQTTVYCADSQSNDDSQQHVCQAGPFSCVGQAPGALCEVNNGIKSYCIQVAVYPTGGIGCSCQH